MHPPSATGQGIRAARPRVRRPTSTYPSKVQNVPFSMSFTECGSGTSDSTLSANSHAGRLTRSESGTGVFSGMEGAVPVALICVTDKSTLQHLIGHEVADPAVGFVVNLGATPAATAGADRVPSQNSRPSLPPSIIFRKMVSSLTRQ